METINFAFRIETVQSWGQRKAPPDRSPCVRLGLGDWISYDMAANKDVSGDVGIYLGNDLMLVVPAPE